MNLTINGYDADGVKVYCSFEDGVNFLSGESGVGKSYLLELIEGYCYDNNIQVDFYSSRRRSNITPIENGVVLIDNADIFLTEDIVERLQSVKCISIICMHNIQRLNICDYKRHVVISSDNKIKTKRV